MNSIVREPDAHALKEPVVNGNWCRQLFERGLSHRGLPLKRKFRPRCCAKTRAGAPCIMRVVPGKRRCRFHGGLSTGPKTKAGRARIAEVQRRRWKAFRGVARLSQIPSKTPERTRAPRCRKSPRLDDQERRSSGLCSIQETVCSTRAK